MADQSAPAPPAKASKPKPPPAKKAMPSPAEIEAKRQARAEKKKRDEALKQERAAQGVVVPAVDSKGRALYRARPWASVPPLPGGAQVDVGGQGRYRLKVLTWNILAQALVRRKLFPGSDAMRWSDRQAGLSAELLGHGWDVACFQEVDRLEVHAQTLQGAGYSHIYAKGNPLKQHGLLLAWRSTPRAAAQEGEPPQPVFEQQPFASHVLSYDDALVDGTEPSQSAQGGDAARQRTGCSRITRNIALFAAIRFQQPQLQQGAPSTAAPSHSPKGVILATTHLFWHPMHAYERARQAGILARALDRFCRDVAAKSGANAEGDADADTDAWPTILAGDFNDQPHSATYALLTGRPLDEHAREEVARSSVVHQSIDERREREARRATGGAGAGAAAGADGADAGDGEEEGDAEGEGEGEGEEEGADDQMLKNCRAAQPADGLLTLAELEQLHDLSREPPSASAPDDAAPAPTAAPAARLALRSAYASGYHRLASPSEHDNLFSSPSRGRERWDDASWQPGDPNVHAHLFPGRLGEKAPSQGGPGAEPMWTLYSPLFGLTLDFIFLFPSLSLRRRAEMAEGDGDRLYPRVTQLLRTHRTDALTSTPHAEPEGQPEADANANGQTAAPAPLPGLPRKGVCVSDHIAIGAELEL